MSDTPWTAAFAAAWTDAEYSPVADADGRWTADEFLTELDRRGEDRLADRISLYMARYGRDLMRVNDEEGRYAVLAILARMERDLAPTLPRFNDDDDDDDE